MQSWWMDAVCNHKNWDVLICEKNNNYSGRFSILLYKKVGI